MESGKWFWSFHRPLRAQTSKGDNVHLLVRPLSAGNEPNIIQGNGQ